MKVKIESPTICQGTWRQLMHRYNPDIISLIGYEREEKLSGELARLAKPL